MKILMKLKLSYIIESPMMDNDKFEILIDKLTKIMKEFSKENELDITNIKVKDMK